jgi:type IV fimbrial biogenesis protein FimT
MRKDSGFSLMELMVTIGVVAILATIAIPNFVEWRSNSQLGRAARDVYSNFQKAKFEAARRNTVVTMTFRAVENDYLVWVDEGAAGYQPGEEIVGPIPWSSYPGVSLDTSEGGGDGLSFPANWVAFTPNGLIQNFGGTVFLNNEANKKSRIVVSPAGNVRIE